ncbi:MAG: hypothetical protein FWH53_07565 [Leptospirales bacterium]|nr:hypothetical protein [Leptospirales bacterium]
MNKKIILALIIYFFQIAFANASIFEELDKLPDGAHEGQMLLGCFGSIGLPLGNLINAEKDFVKGDSYTFSESETTKEFLITHLAYDFGLFLEYMPIDHVGIKSKVKRAYIVQRTLFGSNFNNWVKPLYNSYSFLIGPSLHLTNRKQWDISLTPMIGYSIAKYKPTPIAEQLIENYSGDNRRDVNGIVYGAELNFAMYYSGGLYVSIGFEWNKYPLSLDPKVKLENPNTHKIFEKTSGDLQSINFVLSVGYAFSN